MIRTVDGAWINISHSFEGETNQELTPSPSDKARLRNSAKHRPGQPGGGWVRPGSGARSTPQSTPRSTLESTCLGQVDPQVDSQVDLAWQVDPRVDPQVDLVGWAGTFPAYSDWAEIQICFRNLNFLKLHRAIIWSYGLRFSKTRTLFRVFFRDERNGVSRFP